MNQRKVQARRNLQRLIEAYLREESSMRWGATRGQIRAAAKQMIANRCIPVPLVNRLREKLNAICEQSASEMEQ